MIRHGRHFASASMILMVLLAGCGLVPTTGTPGTGSVGNTLVYDAPVSLTIRNGNLLPGTSIAFGGKTQTGAARVLISGLIAAKQTGDTLDWQGTPAPNTNVKLTTRIASYDEQAVTLVGTAHIEVSNLVLQPERSPITGTMEFLAPVTYSIGKNLTVPGTSVSYVGPSAQGAQFGGIEGYPYRKELDSLQYIGRLNSRTGLRLDLRVLSYSESNVLVAGTANIRIQSE